VCTKEYPWVSDLWQLFCVLWPKVTACYCGDDLLSVVSLQVWCWDAMFRSTVKCGTVSMCVSQIIVSPGNSQIFLADAPCDMLPTGHAAWSQHRFELGIFIIQTRSFTTSDVTTCILVRRYQHGFFTEDVASTFL